MKNLSFYNPEYKEKFLSGFEEGTRVTYSYILSKAELYEGILKKDLCQFDLHQIAATIERINPLNNNVSRQVGRIISSYINWAIEENIRTDENPLKHIGNEFFDNLVVEKRLYISEQELIKIEKKLVNFQDKVIIRLLFEGVSGEGLSELTNLKSEHIKGNTVLLINSDGEERTLELSDIAIEYMNKALKETEYQSKNGQSLGQRSVSPLTKSSYIIRPTARKGTKDDAPVSKFVIFRRIVVFQEVSNNKYISAKQVEKSGMLKMAKDLLLRDGVLDKKQLDEIVDRFNIAKNLVNGYEVSNYTSLRSYISLDTIKSLYNL